MVFYSALIISHIQYILRNMHTVLALLCFVVVIHWLIFPYPSGLLHWHCRNLTIAPVPAKQPWWIWIDTSCEFIMNDSITTTKQSTTKPCAYFLGYTVPMFLYHQNRLLYILCLNTLESAPYTRPIASRVRDRLINVQASAIHKYEYARLHTGGGGGVGVL